MTQEERDKKILDGIEEINTRLGTGSDRFSEISTRLNKVERERKWVLVIFILGMIITAFSGGYAFNSGNALDDQTEANRIQGAVFRQVACANARSTASAFRESSPGESRRHFLRRMFNQRETLLTAGDLECPDINGFFNFELQRLGALKEIEAILKDSPAFRRTIEQGSPGRSFETVKGGQATGDGSGDGGTDSPDGQSKDPGGEDPGGGRPDRPDPDSPDRPDPKPDPDPDPPDNPPVRPSPDQPDTPQESGLLDGALDQTTKIVCRVNPLGIKVCTPR